MNKRFLLIGVAVLILAASFLLFNRRKSIEPVSTTGIVEGTEVNLSSKVSGRISEFCCKEGDRVFAGQVLLSLESYDIKALVEQARAGVLKAKADISSAEAALKNSKANLEGAEAEIKSAHAGMDKARIQMQEAEKEMHRAEFLYKDDLISSQEVDVAMASYESAVASYNAAEANLKAVKARRDSVISQINSSRSLLASAKAGFKEAGAALSFQEARFKDTEIITPISGTVVFKGMEAGEVVSPGVPVLTIVDLEDLWVRIDLEETYIGHVRIGDEAAITINGMPGRSFKGRVAEIGREADFATQRDVTRGRQDIKTFRVKIKTEDTTGTLKPGMTVRVKFNLK